jgi:hypothetical protein
VFEQYAAILHQKYPEISVEGDTYPPPDYKVMLARAMVCDQICINLFLYVFEYHRVHSYVVISQCNYSVTQQLLKMKYSTAHSVFIVEM